jgi:hypothetical protein
MRKWHVCLALGLSLLLWRQAVPSSQTQLFDSKKSQQELEIMKGILRTTLDFAAKELQGTGSDDKRGRFDFGGFSNISASTGKARFFPSPLPVCVIPLISIGKG